MVRRGGRSKQLLVLIVRSSGTWRVALSSARLKALALLTRKARELCRVATRRRCRRPQHCIGQCIGDHRWRLRRRGRARVRACVRGRGRRWGVGRERGRGRGRGRSNGRRRHRAGLPRVPLSRQRVPLRIARRRRARRRRRCRAVGRRNAGATRGGAAATCCCGTVPRARADASAVGRVWRARRARRVRRVRRSAGRVADAPRHDAVRRRQV